MSAFAPFLDLLLYLYYDWIYDGYEANAGYYGYLSQMYRGYASLYAAYQY